MTKYEKIALIISILSLVVNIIALYKQVMKTPNAKRFQRTSTRQAHQFCLFEMSLTPLHVDDPSFITFIITQFSIFIYVYIQLM